VLSDSAWYLCQKRLTSTKRDPTKDTHVHEKRPMIVVGRTRYMSAVLVAQVHTIRHSRVVCCNDIDNSSSDIFQPAHTCAHKVMARPACVFKK